MEHIAFWIGQALGGVAIVIGFITFQMRTQGKLLFVQTSTCLLFCIHYLLIGAYAGMAMNLICIFRNIVFYQRNKRGSTEKVTPILFAVILGVVGLLSWEAWYSVFVFFGIIVNTLCMALPDAQTVRKSILITSPMVLLYNVFAVSIGGMVYESVAIVSALIGILRYRKK